MSYSLVKNFCFHLLLIFCIAIVMFPLYIAVVASTHTSEALLNSPLPLFPGSEGINNYKILLTQGAEVTGGQPLLPMLYNSLKLALIVSLGKVFVSILSAFAFVYFKFPLRKFCFWLVFATLMLPIEVRILPTFQVVSTLGMMNSFSALCLPLIASATATFLFRQFFLTIPYSLADAARMDGATPWRFFKDIIFPLSRMNIVALFIIMFIYGCNQYLWPIVALTDSQMSTVLIGISQLMSVADQIPQWNFVMGSAILAMLIPVIIIVSLEKWFEKGLIR
ncbi:MAG: sn-glycerol-3-phosphate ABC transporter permease UgpE, partial [Legionellales bacterium]|nr:sn-glycerol-3-phosphate ABC transporter permease UgpE [Legionellales bacterium]